MRSGASVCQLRAVSVCRAGRGRGRGAVHGGFSFVVSGLASSGSGSGPVTDSAAATPRRTRRAATAASISGAEVAVRARARRRRRAARATTAAVAGAGASGARRSSAAGGGEQLDRQHPGQPVDRPAQLARRRTSPSRRGPPASPRTGSSRRDAGTASRLSSETIAGLGVLGDHVAGVDARVVGQERRQPVVAGDVEEAVGAPLGDRRHVGDDDGQEVQHVGRPARRGSCRWTRPGRRAVTTGLSMALASSRAGDDARRGRAVSRAAPCTCGRAAQRVGVLHAGALRAAVAGHDRASRPAARACWRRDCACPGCGRSACRSAAKTRVGAEQALDAHRGGDVGGAQQQRAGRASASTSMPSMPSVPLISARPSFSASSTGRDPGRGAAPRRPGAARRSASRTSPSPISASAQCASGARSPEQPSEPYSWHDRGDAGVEHARRRPARSRGRTPVRPVASVDSRSSISARTTSRSTSGPEPAACERIRRALQLGAPLERDVPGGQRAEAGRDAVVRPSSSASASTTGAAAPRSRRAPPRTARTGGAVPGDGDDVVRGERADADADGAQACDPWDTRRRGRGPAPGAKLSGIPDIWTSVGQMAEPMPRPVSRPPSRRSRCCPSRPPGRPLPAAAIARDLGLPRSTTYHLLGVARRRAASSCTCPRSAATAWASRAFELGSGYIRQAPLRADRPAGARPPRRPGRAQRAPRRAARPRRALRHRGARARAGRRWSPTSGSGCPPS